MSTGLRSGQRAGRRPVAGDGPPGGPSAAWVRVVRASVDATGAEWVKLRTAPGTFWLLAAVVVGTVALSVAAVGATHCPPAMACPVDTTKLSLTGIQLGQAVVAILAVLAISGEYSTAMIRVTLAAMPRRAAVLTVKAILVSGLVLVAGGVAVGGCVLAGGLILPGHGFTVARGFPIVSLAYGPTLRAAGGSVLYLALIALLSLGVAALVRDSAVSIGTVLALLYLAPIVIAFISSTTWQARLERWTPTSAGLAIEATTGLRHLAISPWAGLGVLGCWAAGAMLVGGLAFRFRDA